MSIFHDEQIISAALFKIKHFLSVNFFRRTMHSKSVVANVAEPSRNAFGKEVTSSMQRSIVN